MIVIFWFDNFFKGNNVASRNIVFGFNILDCCLFKVVKPENIIGIGILKSYCIVAITFSALSFFSSLFCWYIYLSSDNFCISSSSFLGLQSFKLLLIIRLHCAKACTIITTPTLYAITRINNFTNSASQLYSGLYCSKCESVYTYKYMLEFFLLI